MSLACYWRTFRCSLRVKWHKNMLHVITYTLSQQSFRFSHSVNITAMITSHVASLGTDLQRPLTSYDLPDLGINTVGHMTTLQGTKKWAGLGKHGERFIANVFSMIQSVLPAHHRAVLSLAWMRYEKLKVGVT